MHVCYAHLLYRTFDFYSSHRVEVFKDLKPWSNRSPGNFSRLSTMTEGPGEVGVASQGAVGKLGCGLKQGEQWHAHLW